MSLLYNVLSRFVEKHLLISWLPSLSAVLLEPSKIVCRCFRFFPIYLPWSDGTRCHDPRFWMLSFKPAFHSPLSPSSSSSLVLLCFLPLGWCHLHIWGYWYFSQQSWFQLVLHPAQHFAWCTLHISYMSKVTIYSLDVLLFQFGTSPLFHVWF